VFVNDNARYEDLEFQERVTEQRVTGLWGTVGTLILVVLVLAGWNIFLLRGTQRANEGLARAFAAMDSLRAEQALSADAAKDLDTRLTELAQIEDQIHTRASAGAVNRLAESVKSLEQSATFTDQRLDEIAAAVRDQSGQIAGVGDSLAVVRGLVEEQGRTRIAALEQSAAQGREHMAALDRQMETLNSSYRRAKWFSAASDVLGLVNFGIIVPHVADHVGR